MILVIGGLGFLGSHIALSLMAEGQEVILVDNFSNSNIQTLKHLEYITQKYINFVKLDIRNTPALVKVFEEFPIMVVIHAAGFKSVDESIVKPLEYYNENVGCIMSLLRAMQRTGIRNLIYLSSLQVYGISSLELVENTPINYDYDNPYIKSQQMVEQIIQDTFHTDNEWKMIILRIANVVGAFENAIIGEIIPPFPKNIVSLALQVAVGIRDNIELRYSIETEDHTVERSFVHVLDLCFSLKQSLKLLYECHHILEVFNIGGPSLSIAKLLKVIEEITGKSIQIIDNKYYEFNELSYVGTESLKAKNILFWKSERNIQQMITDQWLFYGQAIQNQLR